MSTPTDFEARLSADLTHRAALIQPPADGRARIDGRVRHRARRRTQTRVAVSILVVMVLAASALALYRSGDDGSKVVSVPGQPVPPMPQLGLAPADGDFWVQILRPGVEVDVQLLPKLGAYTSGGGPLLVVWLSEQSLADFESVRVPPGTPAVDVSVQGQPAFAYDVRSDPTNSAGSASGLYWKPDASHFAYLPLPHLDYAVGAAAIQGAVDLADLVSPIGDVIWTAQLDVTAALDTTGTGDFPGYGPSARLGLPGRTTLTQLAPRERSVAALDVEGFPAGTFFVAPSLVGVGLAPLESGQGSDPVTVRGTNGFYGTTSPAPKPQPKLFWVEDGVAIALIFEAPSTRDDALRVADRLRVLNEEEWRALQFPTTVPLSLVPVPTIPLRTPSCYSASLGCPFWDQAVPPYGSTMSPTPTVAPTTTAPPPSN